MEIGFGKADLSAAGIFEDPVSDPQGGAPNEKYRREEKFAISDRVEGRWRPGSGGTRKLADPIFVTAMYGEDSVGPWAVIALDKVTLSFAEVDLLAKPLSKELGIQRARTILLPSHSHATPPLDPELFQAAVLGAVRQARDSRTEVEIASLGIELEAEKYVINRRVHVDGIGSRTVMFNDGCTIHDDFVDATEHIQAWVKNLGVDPEKHLEAGKKYVTDGEIDGQLQTLFMRDKQTGELKGSFTRFAAHPVIVSAKVVNGDVSADFPGYMKRQLEETLGGIAMFGQGPSGDLRPLNKEYSHAFARTYGHRLAEEIVGRFDGLEWRPLNRVELFREPLGLSPTDVVYLSKNEVDEEMNRIEELFDRETDPGERRKLQNRFWALYRKPSVERMVRPEWKQQKQLPLYLHALKLNDAVLLATPGEIFTRIGKEIVAPYRDRNPVLVSIANEYVSYLPTDEERLKGGYESAVCIMTPGSPDILVEAAHRLLGRVYAE